MRAPGTLAAWCFSVLLLSACDKGPTLPRVEPTVPPVEPIKVEPGTTRSPAANPTVPPAGSVAEPANEGPKADASTGRSNSTMTRAEESNAMPMAGQNNDHSAPLTSEKGASAP